MVECARVVKRVSLGGSARVVESVFFVGCAHAACGPDHGEVESCRWNLMKSFAFSVWVPRGCEFSLYRELGLRSLGISFELGDVSQCCGIASVEVV